MNSIRNSTLSSVYKNQDRSKTEPQKTPTKTQENSLLFYANMKERSPLPKKPIYELPRISSEKKHDASRSLQTVQDESPQIVKSSRHEQVQKSANIRQQIENLSQFKKPQNNTRKQLLPNIEPKESNNKGNTSHKKTPTLEQHAIRYANKYRESRFKNNLNEMPSDKPPYESPYRQKQEENPNKTIAEINKKYFRGI